MVTDKGMVFEFEADFAESLRCIPMGVRYKLDTCGIKLKLEQWHQFSAGDRQRLLNLPCTTPEEQALYRKTLTDLIWQYTQTPATELPLEEHPPWLDATQVPRSVQEQAAAVGIPLNLSQWQAFTPLQRFALIKLSRARHENRNFLPALQEFQR